MPCENRAWECDQPILAAMPSPFSRPSHEPSPPWSDINLGDSISGFEVAKPACTLNPEVKVVYVTGRPSNARLARRLHGRGSSDPLGRGQAWLMGGFRHT